MPEISIIVPVYKVEPYLSQCIESILAQSFSDFELILVDDGSPDNCGSICDEYASQDHRIQVVHQSNGGLASARNTGILHATGTYLCFVDSDDMLAPTYCESLYQAIIFSQCKIAACKIRRFEDGSYSEVNSHVSHEKQIYIIPSEEFLHKQITGDFEMGVCNRLYHRSIFEKIRFMDGKLHEDIIFAGDLFSEIHCDIACIDLPLYYYRQRTNSIMTNQSANIRCSADRIFAGEYLLACVKAHGCSNIDDYLIYAIQYPWCFVDSIYVHHRFHENVDFLHALQKMLRTHRTSYQHLDALNSIQKKRMLLFANSKLLYGFNAYIRLARVYLYHIIGRDAYTDGHGI